jgi:glucokinase
VRKPFVVISGLPGSGKTTLARRLAPALGLPLIDKDDILDRLFESKGIGDAAWRKTLSRESDAILQRETTRSSGAVLASFWHLPGMPVDSGTPTDWLHDPSHHLVNLHCACEPEVAAHRFQERHRHQGHLDNETSYERLLENLRRLARLPRLAIVPSIDVDMSGEPQLDDLVRSIRAVFGAERPDNVL